MILQANSGIAIKKPVIPRPNKRKTKIESDSRTLVYSYGKNAEIIKVEDYTTKMAVYLTYDVMGRETKRPYAAGILDASCPSFETNS